MTTEIPPPEFSRSIELTGKGGPITALTISAQPAERAALARRFGLVALDRLEAELRLEFLPGKRLRLAGRLRAAVIQSCVVTLEPVPAEIDQPFTIIYRRDAPEEREIVIAGDDDEDWAEPWPGNALDVGEAAAQQLALVLEPYPRAPGAQVELPQEPAASPFAALAIPPKARP